MNEATLLHELVRLSAERDPGQLALTADSVSLTYGALEDSIRRFRDGLLSLGLGRGERVGIYLEKRFETVIASFGAPATGGVFVPLNPLLKPDQVAYILRDCNVRVLVTSNERLALLGNVLPDCHDLLHVVVVGERDVATEVQQRVHIWHDLLSGADAAPHRPIRRRYAGYPLHLGQHRKAQRRSALSPQYGGRGQERRELFEEQSR